MAISGVAIGLTVEAGWIVTEVGRQPWVVYEVMKTEQAVTGASGIWVTFAVAVVLYTALGAAAILILRSMARRWREGDTLDTDVPYGPGKGPPAAVGGGSG